MREELFVRTVARDVLLKQQGRGTQHRKTSVLQLTQLHLRELRRVLRKAKLLLRSAEKMNIACNASMLDIKLYLEVEGVESKITGGALSVLEEREGLNGS